MDIHGIIMKWLFLVQPPSKKKRIIKKLERKGKHRKKRAFLMLFLNKAFFLDKIYNNFAIWKYNQFIF